MAIAPLAFSQLATTGVTADPRAELERLRKLKRLKELEAKASGAAPQPAPAQPVTAGPVNQTDATNPIVAAQRASQVQTGNAFAAQKAAERQTVQPMPRPAAPDLRNVNRAPQTTGPDYTNYGPGAAMGGADIGKGLKTLPQHAVNAVIGAVESTANLPADLINSSRQANANTVVDDRMAMMNANRMPQLQDRVGAPKPSTPPPMLPTFNAPRIPIAEQDASVTGSLIEGLGQWIVGRVGIGKLAKGGGIIPGLAKDLTTTGVALQGNTGRVADMINPEAIPEGPLRDFATWLRTQPEDSPIMGRLKNVVEDALATGPALVPQTAVRGVQAVGNAINDAVNPQMAPTSAGAARPGPLNTATLEPRAPSAPSQPPQTPANALASPPAPAQAASAAQPSVVPQPTVSQAGTAGTGQQAGAGVGAVPPAGPATLQATPQVVPPVNPSAIAKSDRQIIGRLLKAGGVPGNDVDNVLAGMVEAFNRTNSPNSRLLLFAEDYLPTVLPKQVADDVKQQLRGFLYERTSRGGKAGDQSRAIALSNIEQIRGSQKGRLTDVIENKLGDTSLKTTRGKIRGDKSLNAEAVYKKQIDATQAALDAGSASQKQIDARDLLLKKMSEPSYFDRIPQEIKERAANDGIDLAEAIKSNPLEIAHWLQSRLGFLERKKLDPNAGFYRELRVGLLRPLEDAVNGYRGARMRHGDLVGQEIATKFGNNLITNAAKIDAVDEMADAYKRLAPSQREVAKRSMRDALLNEFRKGRAATAVDPVTGARVDNQAAKITRLQTAGVIDALPRILGKDGEDIADEIMAISRENERLAPYGSDTETNFAKVEAAQDAVRSPVNKAAGAFDDNNSLIRTVIYDALLMAAHMPPVATLAKGGSWVAGKLGSPSAKKLASATETLIGRPPAGSANALASPPPRAPRGPSTPRAPIPRPPVTQELLDDLLKQYSALNHARAPKKSEDLAKRIVRVRNQLEKQTTEVAAPTPQPATPANAFNAEPQPATQAPAAGNAFNGKRPLPGETSNASPAVTGALIGGTAGYVASDGDPTATLAGAVGVGAGAQLLGNRLSKLGASKLAPKPPVPKAPVAGGPVATKDRAVWEMRGAGLSNAEIARRADTTEGMVDVHYRKAERALGAPPSDPSVLSKYPEKAPTQAAESVSTSEPFTSKAGNATLNYEERPFWWADDSLDVSMDYVPEKPPTLSETKDLFTQMYDRMKAKMQAEGRSVYSANGDTPSKRKLYDRAVKALPPPDGYTPMKSPGSDMILFVRDDMVGKLPEGAPKDLAPISSVTPLKPAPKPTRNSAGVGAAGGMALGGTFAPDANGDGVVDAQERANGALGGAFSGGIGGAVAGRALGAFGRGANKLARGPERAGNRMNQQTFGNGRKPSPELIGGTPEARQRGIEMGFDMDTPLYHGTNQNIEEFMPGANRAGASGSREGPMGVWLTNSPETASSFSDWAGRGQGGDNVMPVYTRLKNPLVVDDYEKVKDIIDQYTKFERPDYVVGGRQIRMMGDKPDYQAARKALEAQGYDGIIVRNTMVDSMDGKPIDQVLVFDPKNIRGQFAKFDPAKSDSPIIMNGFGSGKAESRPKPPPANRLSGGQKPPARSSTASRMVAGGVIGGIAGSAGSADPQDMAIDTQMSETKAQMAAAQQSMRDLQAILDIYDKGTPQQVQETVGRGGKYTKPDGVIGPDTSAKVDADRKRIAAEMKAYAAQMDKGRARLKDLEEQQAYAKTKPSAQQQIFRELGPLVGALVGVGLGAKLRGGAVKKYAAEVPNKVAKANALLTPGPLNKSRSVAAQAALRQQPSNINEFWIQGGAKDKVPFELSAKGKPVPRRKSDVMPPSKLFPTPRFRSMDIGVIAGSLVESGAAQLYAMQLEGQIKDARELAKDKPTEANLAHVQALEDQHAVVQALSRLGAGIAAGRAVGALKMPYPSARANVPAADAERALLLEHFRKVK